MLTLVTPKETVVTYNKETGAYVKLNSTKPNVTKLIPDNENSPNKLNHLQPKPKLKAENEGRGLRERKERLSNTPTASTKHPSKSTTPKELAKYARNKDVLRSLQQPCFKSVPCPYPQFRRMLRSDAHVSRSLGHLHYFKNNMVPPPSKDALNKARMALLRTSSLRNNLTVTNSFRGKLTDVAELKRRSLQASFESSKDEHEFLDFEKWKNHRNLRRITKYEEENVIYSRQNERDITNGKENNKLPLKRPHTQNTRSDNRFNKLRREEDYVDENKNSNNNNVYYPTSEGLDPLLKSKVPLKSVTASPQRARNATRRNKSCTKSVSFECTDDAFTTTRQILRAENTESDTNGFETNGYGGVCPSEAQKLLLPIIMEDNYDYCPPSKEEENFLPKIICFILAIFITVAIVYVFTFLVTRMNINLFGAG